MGTKAKSFLCLATSVTTCQKKFPAVFAEPASMAPAGLAEHLSGQGMPDAGRFPAKREMDAATGSFHMPGRRRVAAEMEPEG